MADDFQISSDAKSASVDLNEDMKFQERTWAAQRVGWWAMALVLLAALAGLFAAGPLSRADTSDPTGALRVEYERFLRHMSPSTLRLRLGPEALSGEVIRIRVSHALAGAVEQIVPEPRDTRATPSGIEYAFGTTEPGATASVQFELNPDGFGILRAEIGLADREPARVTILVYP